MQRVIDAVDAIVAEGSVPAVSVHVRVAGAEVLHHTAGRARLAPERVAGVDQRFDLASLTKPLAGAAVASLHLAAGRMRPDDPVRRWLPGVDARVTVAHLLTHASGLPAWAPLHQVAPVTQWGRPEVRAAVLAAAAGAVPIHPPGVVHVYSDLGFLWLLQVLEALGGPLDAQLAPLLRAAGVEGRLSWDGAGAAATEDCPLRGRVLEGEVHDANCAAMGGVSTHAGLFGDARAVARYAEALLDAHAGRRDDLPAPPWHLTGPGSHRGGWDGVSPGASSTGSSWPADGVGHLGYTGTSVWLAPRQRGVVALLTNRVHPVDDKRAIRAARPRVHDAVAAALGWRV